MTLRQHFDVDKLRQSLFQSEDPKSRKHSTATARLVAAFYLGLPLFELEDNEKETYPTLFEWVHLAEKDIAGKRVSREVAVQEIPEEFSSRLPVALLLHLTRDLEAVLYTDYFCDRRSALVLRVLVDHSLGLDLTSEYVANFLINIVDQSTGVAGGDSLLCEQLLPAVLELDVILSRSYMRSLEEHLLDQMELLFASLPLKSAQVTGLPRPPVYLLQPNTMTTDKETSVLLKIHSFIRVVLSSLYLTNRLQFDLKRTIEIFSEPEAEYSGGKTLVLKLAVTVLSLIYRDQFTLAEQEKWIDLPEVAMRYKALIESDDAQEAVRRWHSLANRNDVNHVNLFFEYVKNTFQSQNSLPPLDSSSRDVWYEYFCHREEGFHSARGSADWITGAMLITRRVASDVWEQMEYLATKWKGVSLPDPTIIPLRLLVSPDILCKPLPSPKRITHSARDALESVRENKLFLPRSQILEEYTLKAKKELSRRKVKEKRKAQTQREPRYMRSTLGPHQLHEIAESQSELRKSVEAEKVFLQSPLKNHSHRHSLSSLSSSSSSLSSRSNIREDVIRRDIKKLDNKIEVIGKLIVDERKRAESQKKGQPEFSARSERSASEASILPLPDNYNEIPAVEGIPYVEKLDFTMLTPSPRPVRLPSPEEMEEEDEGTELREDEELRSQVSALSMSTAQSFKELSFASPLKALMHPQTERLPLLHYVRSESASSTPVVVLPRYQMAMTERSVQTANMTIGEMKPLSRQDVSAVLRARQT